MLLKPQNYCTKSNLSNIYSLHITTAQVGSRRAEVLQFFWMTDFTDEWDRLFACNSVQHDADRPKSSENSIPATDGWDEVYDDVLQSSQEHEKTVNEVNDLRSETCSESEDSSSSSSVAKLRLWWAQVLYRATLSLDHSWPKFDRPISVVSGCTGCSAEAATLKVQLTLL